MKTHVLMCLALLMAGCSSLDHAGTAEYSIKPFVVDAAAGKLACCEITVKNGKEIASLEAEIRKTGDDFVVILKEQGVVAFRGQEISAGAAKTTAESAAGIGAAALGAGLKVLK